MIDEMAPGRCPVCDGSLEALRSHRFIPVAGRWREQGKVWWTVKCANAHQGDGDTLAKAVENVRRRR